MSVSLHSLFFILHLLFLPLDDLFKNLNFIRAPCITSSCAQGARTEDRGFLATSSPATAEIMFIYGVRDGVERMCIYAGESVERLFIFLGL